MTSTAAAAVARRHHFDVEACHRLGETGVRAPDARVELIEEDIVDLARPRFL